MAAEYERYAREEYHRKVAAAAHEADRVSPGVGGAGPPPPGFNGRVMPPPPPYSPEDAARARAHEAEYYARMQHDDHRRRHEAAMAARYHHEAAMAAHPAHRGDGISPPRDGQPPPPPPPRGGSPPVRGAEGRLPPPPPHAPNVVPGGMQQPPPPSHAPPGMPPPPPGAPAPPHHRHPDGTPTMGEYERARAEYERARAMQQHADYAHPAQARQSPRGEEQQQRLGARVSPRGQQQHTNGSVDHIPPPPGMAAPTAAPGASPAPTPTPNHGDGPAAFPGSTINREQQEARARERPIVPTMHAGDSPDAIRRDAPTNNAGPMQGQGQQQHGNPGPAVREQDEDYVKQSKTLAWILRARHGNVDIGMDDQGWVSIDDLCATEHLQKINVDKARLIQIVQECPKKRFEIEDGKVRASKPTGSAPPPAHNGSTGFDRSRNSGPTESSPFASSGNAWRPRNPPRSATMPLDKFEQQQDVPHVQQQGGKGGFQRRGTNNGQQHPPGYNNQNSMGQGNVSPRTALAHANAQSQSSIADRDNSWRTGMGLGRAVSQPAMPQHQNSAGMLGSRPGNFQGPPGPHMQQQNQMQMQGPAVEAPKVEVVHGLHGGKRHMNLVHFLLINNHDSE